ncbi:S8 family serine peptidase [Virgibacillus profundi]|uniref:S8 family serine peptidase n=1 Tax=Virgibacillus profundi TaxID=2024555 RepID=UPI0013FD7200|nr:S8 family serine peptidase [Virgibacillus profundi]
MSWTSIRDFLSIPKNGTGNGVKIAIIDEIFHSHPEIISNQNRNTFLVKTHTPNTAPIKLTKETQNNIGLHGLWTAAAAGGTGLLSNGIYAGTAPEADMYLIEAGKLNTMEDIETNIGNALVWVKENAARYGIRGVVLTIVGQRDTGLLPWQADPLRILCEELAHKGILVVVASGNNCELTSASVASPSVLAVGGVLLPENGEIQDAESFPGSRGLTFDAKWNPDILSPAMNVVLPFPFKSDEERLNHYSFMNDNLPPNYARQWGTSYAAPIVLGLAACIWQQYPNWSAEQVKTALVSNSVFHKNWDSLKAGLATGDVLKYGSNHCDRTIGISSYLRWKYWKEQPLPKKLDMLNSENHEVIDIILSLLPEKVSVEAINSLQKLLYHPSEKVRTVAITVLSTQPSIISSLDILHCLQDDSPNVKMGGLYALRFCPVFWEELTLALCTLINNENTDIRYNACKLAFEIKSKQFIKPLIDGLEEDARSKRIGTFGKRHLALELITGIEIARDPEWQEGEDPYSNRSINALLKIASKWKTLLT